MPNSPSHTPALEGRTLLDELNHRIKNELASVINLVTYKAVWTDNVDAKEELSNVVDLLHQHVQVHSILTMPDHDALVDAGEQLRKLGLAISRCKLDRMNIRLVLAAETLPLGSERCWRWRLSNSRAIPRRFPSSSPRVLRRGSRSAFSGIAMAPAAAR